MVTMYASGRTEPVPESLIVQGSWSGFKEILYDLCSTRASAQAISARVIQHVTSRSSTVSHEAMSQNL